MGDRPHRCCRNLLGHHQLRQQKQGTLTGHAAGIRCYCLVQHAFFAPACHFQRSSSQRLGDGGSVSASGLSWDPALLLLLLLLLVNNTVFVVAAVLGGPNFAKSYVFWPNLTCSYPCAFLSGSTRCSARVVVKPDRLAVPVEPASHTLNSMKASNACCLANSCRQLFCFGLVLQILSVAWALYCFGNTVVAGSDTHVYVLEYTLR